MQVYLFCGKLLLTFFIQRLQTFFIFVTFFTFFNVFYFEWNVFIIYVKKPSEAISAVFFYFF